MAFQGVKIISRKDKKTNNAIIFIKKTGYANVWIGDQHIYWNYNVHTDSITGLDFNQLANSQQKDKKQKIIVRRR